MDKNEITPINRDFLQGVSDVLAQARKNAKAAVNLAMVYAYFEIGRMIVEEEQHGAARLPAQQADVLPVPVDLRPAGAVDLIAFHAPHLTAPRTARRSGPRPPG